MLLLLNYLLFLYVCEVSANMDSFYVKYTNVTSKPRPEEKKQSKFWNPIEGFFRNFFVPKSDEDIETGEYYPVDPGWEVSETKDQMVFRDKMTTDAYNLFMKNSGDLLDSLQKSVDNSQNNLDRRWINALDTYSITETRATHSRPRRGRWASYYSFVWALKTGKFRAAEQYAVNDLALYYKHMTPDVKEMMLGGPQRTFPSVFALMASAWMKDAANIFDDTKYLQMLTACGKVVYDVLDITASYNPDYKNGKLLKKETITTAKDRMGIIYALFRAKDFLTADHLDILEEAVKADWIDVAHIFLCYYLNGKPSIDALRTKNLYTKVKSYAMVKLLKGLNVPILASQTNFLVRSKLYAIEDQVERSKILSAVKINKDSKTCHDKEFLRIILSNNVEVDLRNRIFTRDPDLVKMYFIKEGNCVRNDTEHFIAAIRHQNSTDVLKVLLEERVHKPKADVLENVLNEIKNGPLKKSFVELIAKYDRFYNADGTPKVPGELFATVASKKSEETKETEKPKKPSKPKHQIMFPDQHFPTHSPADSNMFFWAVKSLWSLIEGTRFKLGFGNWTVDEKVLEAMQELNKSECETIQSMIGWAWVWNPLSSLTSVPSVPSASLTKYSSSFSSNKKD